MIKTTRVVIALIASYLLAGTSFAESPVSIKLNAKAPEATVPDDFGGLSYEMALVPPDANGKYFFSPENTPLVKMFQTLGVRILRVGGNTADRPTVKFPGNADLDKLFAFAEAAKVKVIFTLRMRQGDPKDAAAIAKYIMDHYQADLVCFAIGNEPNVFAKTYPAYQAELEKYIAAITASGVAPEAKFCGPSTTPNKAVWARDFANDFAHTGRIALITQHDYPGGSGRKVTNSAAGRDNMLSTAWPEAYQKFYASFVPATVANGIPYRLEEANNYYNGGAKDVSDTFAAALWGLDYLHWWAAHGANGINFHSGDTVAAGEENAPCRYAVFWTSPSGYSAHPLGYALKAFELGGYGQLVPAQIAANADDVNLTAYGLLAKDKSLLVTLINKDHSTGAHDAKVTLTPGDAYAKGTVMYLTGPQGDVAATSGITLGGAPIKDNASWKGKWTKLAKPSASGEFTVKLPAATAAVIKLTRK
ncbi:MAG: hypothetical protein JWR19_2115 [Pedosphaera sp.]|nr:hypothetical protein [Pedosphaera sp.]